MKTTSLSVIIPVFNESEKIKSLIQKISETCTTNGITHEIIIIDDHSTDQTQKIIKKLDTKYPVSYFKKTFKAGKGYSILQGYQQALYPYIAIIDADHEISFDFLPQLLELAIENGFACAKTRRSRIAEIVDTKPCQGTKIFYREIFEHLDHRLVSPWVIETPLIYTAKELGYRGGFVQLDYKHEHRHKSMGERLRRSYQRIEGYWKTKIRRRIFSFAPTHDTSMLGAGVAFKKKRFITHTTLPIQLSALKTFSSWQLITILVFILFMSYGLVAHTLQTLIGVTAVLSAIYLGDVVFNLYVTLKSLHFPPEIATPDEVLRKLKDKDLPIYSILCPLYKEGKVLPQFVEAIDKLDWPKNKLEVMLLLEEDDADTISIARDMQLPSHYSIVVVPHSNPKTKPKACNYGLALATGEYIVIYDAEDKPDPMQLKNAYAAFKQSGSTVACLQAKLNYYNPNHNLLTRLFTAEYSLWFDVTLPGLQSIRTTIPLGGTSNHFRTKLLRELQGWDPFNVTEDCDLGARLFNAGYKTAIIDSTTLEEANSNWKNWFRQRSRWIKGYMQTYLVHMRDPIKLFKNQGLHALLFQLIVGGKITFILINPILWLMTLSYFVLYQYVGLAIESIYPAGVFYMAATSLVVGNFVALYNYMIGCAKRGHWHLVKYVFLIPIYWLAISYSALIALYQLFFKPHYWEKTIHGLHLDFAAKVGAKAEQKATTASARNRIWQRYVDLVAQAITAGGIMIIASVMGNVLNFFYTAYLGRHLNLADFGEISLFGNLLTIIQVPIGALGRAITHQSAFLLGKYGHPVKEIWVTIRSKSLHVSLLVSGIWILITPLMKMFFSFDSIVPFLLFTPVWFIGTLAAVDSSFLAGSLMFTVLAVLLITEALTKLLFSVALVELGLHEFVYLATPLSMGISLLGAWLFARNVKSPTIKIDDQKKDLAFPKKFYFTSILTSITGICFTTLDVVLAKHYLMPAEAGVYSYLSLAGKMVFLLSGMFSQFIVPYVSRDLGVGNSSKKFLRRMLAAVSLVNLAAVIVFGIFGFITAPLLWGEKVIGIIPHLPFYALAMAAFSISSVYVTYHQVRGEYAFSFAGFFIGIAQVLGIMLWHDTITQIATVVSVTSVISITTMILLHRFYSTVTDIYRNFIDFIGLFRPLPVPDRVIGDNLKILIFNWRDLRHKWAGGAEVYIHELSKRWVQMGHQVTVFAGNDGKSIRHEKIDGVRIIRRGGFYFYFVWAYLYYALRLKGQYDVVIDSENGLPFFTPLYVKEKKYLLIHHVHQEVFRKSLLPPFSWVASFLEKRVMPLVYKNTDVITVSPSSKRDILVHKLTKREPTIIYNGVDLEKYVPGIKSKTPTILYLGRLTTAKSVHVLIQAVPQILKKTPQLHVIIAGDGPQRKSLEKLVKFLKLESIIEFKGKVTENEKIELYQKAWLFVNPSLIEGWGITTIEANACGTPVVASNVAGLKDAVNNKKSGMLVSYGDVEQFAQTISKLLTSSISRTRMSKEAINWAKDFDWNKSAALGIEIIRQKNE